MKTCTACGKRKRITSFHRKSKSTSARRTQCKECHTAWMKAWSKRNPEKVRAYSRDWVRKHYGLIQQRRRARTYGLAPDVFDEMLIRHDGACWACRRVPSGKPSDTICVDHDHTTGAVRGLLCTGCNVALGRVGERVEALQGLVEYLAAARRP